MFGSIYGPGVLNDTIVPGYGVTKFPVNLDTFWSLPNGTTRNFGEATQYVTYPMGRPQFMYDLAQNFTDPNHISNWNPMLIGMNLSNGTTNPFLTQQGQMSAFQWGANMVQQMQIQQAIQGIAGALNSMESSLSNIIKSDNLTNAQKAELAGLLEDVKALKSKIEQQLKAKNPTQDEVIDMQKEVQDLQKKVSEAADKIRADINGSASDSASASSSSADTSASSGTLSDEAKAEIDRKHKENQKKLDQEAADIVSCVYMGAIGVCGTDYDKIKEGTNRITKDNVSRVLQTYAMQYPNIDDGDMIDTLFDEEMGWNCSLHERGADGKVENPDGNVDIIWNIVKCLEERAKELDVYTELQGQFTRAYDELDDTSVGETKVKEAVRTILQKILEKEQSFEEEALNKEYEDALKTETDTKAQERKPQVEAEKKNEFAIKLKEELKLNELPVLSSALKIETDDNGNFTGYSIKLDTPNGEVTLTGITPRELFLAIERQGLELKDVLVRKTQA